MSTGLTYITWADNSISSPETPPNVQVFQTYSEAYDFATYTSVNIYVYDVRIWIWTSGPNQNGYMSNGIFNAID